MEPGGFAENGNRLGPQDSQCGNRCTGWESEPTNSGEHGFPLLFISQLLCQTGGNLTSVCMEMSSLLPHPHPMGALQSPNVSSAKLSCRTYVHVVLLRCPQSLPPALSPEILPISSKRNSTYTRSPAVLSWAWVGSFWGISGSQATTVLLLGPMNCLSSLAQHLRGGDAWLPSLSPRHSVSSRKSCPRGSLAQGQ